MLLRPLELCQISIIVTNDLPCLISWSVISYIDIYWCMSIIVMNLNFPPFVWQTTSQKCLNLIGLNWKTNLFSTNIGANYKMQIEQMGIPYPWANLMQKFQIKVLSLLRNNALWLVKTCHMTWNIQSCCLYLTPKSVKKSWSGEHFWALTQN